MARPYDIVLFGATGFTGSLIARYLINQVAERDARVAIAGRDQQKGMNLIEEIKGETGREVQWITANANDDESLSGMASQTYILMNAAGPFALYAPPVVKACVEEKTHYLDITGEPSFYHDVIDKYHERAQSLGVAIIPACGFDSVPADAGVFEVVKKIDNKKAITVRAYLRTNAKFSGGTWTTAIHALMRRQDSKPLKSGRVKRSSRKIPLKIHYARQIQRWAIPMPILDPHVVKRTSRLVPEEYGQSFAYGQFFTVGSFWKLSKLLFSFSLLFLIVRFNWGQKWLLSQNKPGTGPSAEERDRSGFEFTMIGESDGEVARSVISGGDPGYKETSMMFAECAFLLLEQVRSTKVNGGVLTPIAAFQTSLTELLDRKLGK